MLQGFNAGKQMEGDTLVFCPICELTYLSREKKAHAAPHHGRWKMWEKFGFIPTGTFRDHLERFLWETVKNESNSFELRIEAGLGLLWFYYTKEVRRYSFKGSFTDFLQQGGNLLTVRLKSFPEEVKRFLSAELWIEDLLLEETMKELRKLLEEKSAFPLTDRELFLTTATFNSLCSNLYVYPRKKNFKELLVKTGILKNKSPIWREVESIKKRKKLRGYAITLPRRS
jgi:hypothetical protein